MASHTPLTVRILVALAFAVTIHAPRVHGQEAGCGAISEVDDLKRELAEKDRAIHVLSQQMRRIAQTNIVTVEKALKGTGIKVDRLIKRGGTDNQGGPFIPAGGALGEAGRDIQRWDALQRVMQALPLGVPLATYELASGFGTRRDPINRRRAMHEGVDLVAPLRTPVMATGPGIVAFVGTRGRYGKMVEVDHGLGVRTRYAHLGVTHVRVGQSVRAGQVVGLVGRTGRTTGPHLHYEVVVDGKANNPIRFMKAGARLTGMKAGDQM